MERSKLKNIILAILAVTNILLLGLMLVQHAQSRHFRQQVLQDAVELLAQQGISVQLEDLPQQDFPAPQVVERDPQEELAGFTALLGEDTVYAQRGPVSLYTGSLGCFKLDFIDSFGQPEKEPENVAPGKDYVSVPAAVERLMTDIQKRLMAIKPNLCIEFRQSYIGPLMRRYANMFRAGDCANDTISNRVRTIDMRLTLADSPVHSDMLTWHPDDTPEAAVLQLIATAFAVPQISVRPYNLPESHNAMLKSWLTFWKKNRDTLLFGKFRAHNPDLLYSQASAESADAYIGVAYANGLVMKDAEGDVSKRVFVNGSGEAGIMINVKPGRYSITVENCLGEVLLRDERELGINEFNVPVGGRLTLVKSNIK